MNRHRTATLAIGVALIAPACGGATSADDDDDESGATMPVSTDHSISPSDSTQPLDTSGGDTSGGATSGGVRTSP